MLVIRNRASISQAYPLGVEFKGRKIWALNSDEGALVLEIRGAAKRSSNEGKDDKNEHAQIKESKSIPTIRPAADASR